MNGAGDERCNSLTRIRQRSTRPGSRSTFRSAACTSLLTCSPQSPNATLHDLALPLVKDIMGRWSLISGLAIVVLAVVGVSATEATKLYDKGRAAEKAGHYDQAYVYYSEAAALEPNNLNYWQRTQAVRSRAALQAKPQPPKTNAPPNLLDDQPGLPAATARERADARRAKSPEELQSDVPPQAF